MQFSVTFRHMEATDSLKAFAEERLQRIKKYLPDPIAVNVVMSTERHNHCVDVSVQLHNGFTIGGHEATEDMYSSIDLVTAKIERQVRKYKDKLRAHRAKSEYPPLVASHSILAEDHDRVQAALAAVAEGSSADADSGAGNGAPGPSVSRIVSKTDKFHSTPMSAAEAIMQLNLLHEQFLVFRDHATGGVNVVYRRDDGSYGLIETSPPS